MYCGAYSMMCVCLVCEVLGMMFVFVYDVECYVDDTCNAHVDDDENVCDKDNVYVFRTCTYI